MIGPFSCTAGRRKGAAVGGPVSRHGPEGGGSGARPGTAVSRSHALPGGIRPAAEDERRGRIPGGIGPLWLG